MLNAYLFTGRRVDILDNGSLKIQYNRNRYYDYYSGRWLTHDPLGIDRAGSTGTTLAAMATAYYGAPIIIEHLTLFGQKLAELAQDLGLPVLGPGGVR